MSVGDVAGLIAAIAFVLLVGFLAVPLIKLGRVLDETGDSIKDITEHTLPLLDETAETLGTTNDQLERIDVITARTQEVAENVSALTTLVSATLGGPLVKAAAFSYGVRSALGSLRGDSGGPGDRTRGSTRTGRG